MKNPYKIASLIIGIFLPLTSVFAQQSKDSIFKKLELKEIYIRGYAQSKHPGSQFYQSSNLSSTEDILSKIEGISLVRRGPIGMEPVLRAFSGGQVNVVIDGMKFFGACTDKMDPVTIYTEPVNLKTIDIKYAGDGMAMGSSVGGTLNLKLAEAELSAEKRISGTISSGYYSAAKAIQNIMAIDYSAQKWAFRASGVYKKADNYRNGLNNIVNYSQYQKSNASFSGKYQVDKQSSLKFDFLLDDGWNIGYPALPMDVAYAKARIVALSYKKKYNDKNISILEAKIYANGIRHAMDDTKREFVAMHMDMPGQSETQGAFIQAQFKRKGKHYFNIKLDSYHNRVKADMTMYPSNRASMYMLTWPENHQNVSGIYLQDIISLNQNNRIDLKLRMDAAFSKISDEMGANQFEILGYNVSQAKSNILKNINIGYTYNIGQMFTIYASAGYNERLPSTSERYGFYLFNRMDNHDYLGNPDLKNEKAVNAEINLLISNDKFALKLSGFSTYLNNYIIGKTLNGHSVMTIGASGVRGYQNIKSAKISGAESNFNYEFADRHFTLNHTLKWVYANDHLQNPLPLISPLKSNLSLRFAHAKYQLQAENEISAAQNRINTEFGESSTKSYSILNIRGSYSFDLRKYNLEFSMGAENLFNKAYYEHLDWGKLLRPGRNIYGMLSMKF